MSARLFVICLLFGTQLSAQELSVLSFNIRYGTADDGANAWAARRELVFQVIRDTGADVLGVQEALRFQLDEIASAVPGLAEVGVAREDGDTAGEYSAILFDARRLAAEDHGTFWFSDTPGVPGSMSWGNRITRICTWVRLRERSSGRTFYVYNVHLDHESQSSRERSVELLAHRIAERSHPDPVIVLGDFNAGETNPAIRYLVGNSASPGPRLHDTFRAVHPRADSVGTFHAFQGGASGEKIDYVLTDGEWQVLDAAIVRTHVAGRYPSDHYPVSARVTR
jgi:endonuclease/exonuclease/phosphatase family metal-dependent hydrolase